MAIPNRSYLFCLLLLASLPVDGAAALAVANAQGSAALPGPSLSIEERLSRIAAAVQQQGGVEEAPGGSSPTCSSMAMGWAGAMAVSATVASITVDFAMLALATGAFAMAASVMVDSAMGASAMAASLTVAAATGVDPDPGR